MQASSIRTLLLRKAAVALFAASLLVGCGAPPLTGSPASEVSAANFEVRQALAPTGTLRIAAYAGSPTSLVRLRDIDEAAGMTVDIGRELALQLGVPARIVEFERVEQVIEALSDGRADLTITNATPVRAVLVDFTAPLVRLELGYLALRESAIVSIADIDRPGVRVGVSQGSSSQAALGKSSRHATLVPTASLKVAAEMLKERSIDAFATNKSVLFQLGDGLPEGRVLDGRWGTESLAIAVPKGRDIAKPWLDSFVTAARHRGSVLRAAQRAGLRGLAEGETP